MKADWKSFLISNGAEFAADNESKVASYGNPDVEPRIALGGNVMCDLSHTGLIEAHGNDARSFLQGQTTNNFNDISETVSSLGSYCSAKGRALASFRAFQRGDTFFLNLSQDLVHDTLKRLRMFVLMSKVTLTDGNDALVRFGLSGPKAEDELKQHAGGFPAEVDQVLHTGELSIIRVPGIYPRFQIFGTVDACRKLWERLNMNCAPIGAEAWDLLNIRAGVPIVTQGTREMFVPQMINLQRVNGVSFKKGCYTGQEIIARMHYLGKLKRRMYRVEYKTTDLPAPGTALVAMENGEAQAAGNIVNSVRSPSGAEALAVLIIRFVEEGTPITIATESGAVAKLIEEPPYGFDMEKT